MKKILVIGKTSFVGTSFTEYITEYFPNDYEIETANSRNDSWKEYDFGKYDAIFNVAGIAHVRVKKELEPQYYLINRDMPILMANKAKKEGCRLFIQMSSEIVFGSMARVGKENIITTETKPNPVNCYGDSKLQADLELEKLIDETFHVAMLRPPLIYSEQVRDGNFPFLLKIAQIIPVFPTLKNKQSMLYIYNLTELVRLIIENWGCGYYYPQNREYSSTSRMVKDFTDAFGHKIWMTSIFNTVIKILSPFSSFITRAFGDICYEMNMSGHYGWKYCIYSYEESIKNTVEAYKKKNRRK